MGFKESSKRPVCAHCGRRYGARNVDRQMVRWGSNEERPPYRGALTVVRSGTLGKIATGFHGYHDVWDGVTWIGGYDPFCTLRCALSFARKAYADGLRRALTDS